MEQSNSNNVKDQTNNIKSLAFWIANGFMVAEEDISSPDSLRELND